MTEIQIQVDGKPVNKLQAARAAAALDGPSIWIGEPDGSGWMPQYISVYARHRAFDTIQRAALDCHHFIADTVAEMRQQAAAVTLAAEICDWAEMIAAEQETAKPEPVTWQCTYCWTEFEAMPSEQPPVCPECGPLRGPGARDAQPRIKPEPEGTAVAPEPAEPKLCEYCDVEPATEGKYCAECVPAVTLANAGPEPASAPNPPRYVPPGTGERCRAQQADGGGMCTAQPGHDGPEHVVYGTGGRELSRFLVDALRLARQQAGA